MSDLHRLVLDHCPELLLLVNPASLQIEIANALPPAHWVMSWHSCRAWLSPR